MRSSRIYRSSQTTIQKRERGLNTQLCCDTVLGLTKYIYKDRPNIYRAKLRVLSLASRNLRHSRERHALEAGGTWNKAVSGVHSLHSNINLEHIKRTDRLETASLALSS